eukprot:gnl/TRDRNA2_/TRDRNA2_156557_c1_seq1.p2 gnl/TRDRNA2_/TRDRNA2_156557_c1~~gnl/TRDRNA2_/TRDRNA2_156557_c1_seq1.p2  ORF type:complete len:124 (+),score=56.24 gnl/TRDRNA2_/TRDRNA2_156557_c1_seq1:296-667(+)
MDANKAEEKIKNVKAKMTEEAKAKMTEEAKAERAKIQDDKKAEKVWKTTGATTTETEQMVELMETQEAQRTEETAKNTKAKRTEEAQAERTKNKNELKDDNMSKATGAKTTKKEQVVELMTDQ